MLHILPLYENQEIFKNSLLRMRCLRLNNWRLLQNNAIELKKETCQGIGHEVDMIRVLDP